jgi:hypothetical protein
MNYIKSYKLFESIEDIGLTESIKDLLMDLSDSGCGVIVRFYPGKGKKGSINLNNELFNYSYYVCIDPPFIFKENKREHDDYINSTLKEINNDLDRLHTFMIDGGKGLYPILRRKGGTIVKCLNSTCISPVDLFFSKKE